MLHPVCCDLPGGPNGCSRAADIYTEYGAANSESKSVTRDGCPHAGHGKPDPRHSGANSGHRCTGTRYCNSGHYSKHNTNSRDGAHQPDSRDCANQPHSGNGAE